MEWLSTVFEPLTWILGMAMQGSNDKVLTIFDKTPQVIGSNIYLILIGLWLLKLVAKKTPWNGDDKISSMLSGFVSLVMSGGFTQQNIAQYLEKQVNGSDKTG